MPCFPLLRRHQELSTTPSPPPHHSPKHQPCQEPCGVPQGRAQQFPKVTPGTPCGPSGSCCGASQPWIWGFGDLGSGAWPGAGQCRTAPLFSCPGALVLGDAASLLLPKRAPPAHTLSCSPGEGTARGGHSGKGSRGETRALHWVPAPLLSRVRTQLDARRPQVPHHFGGLQPPQHGPHPTNTSGTESGPPDSQSRG